jgi:hypothetical protein
LQGSGTVARSATLGRSIRNEDRERYRIKAIPLWVAILFARWLFLYQLA